MVGCPLLASGVLCCPLCPFLGSPLAAQVHLSWFFGFCLLVSAPHRCDLAPPKVPQQPFGSPKCTSLRNKTNDFAMPPVFQKLPLRVPLGPAKVALRPPKVPQRAPSRPPMGSPRAFGGALPPKSPPKNPQEHLRPPKGDKQKHRFYCRKTYISAQRRARVNGSKLLPLTLALLWAEM